MAAPRTGGTTLTIDLDAGDAAMVDLGKMLGPTGVNIALVKREYDDATRAHRGEVVPAVITIAEDRSFTLALKTPPTSFLIRRALGIEKGSPTTGRTEAGCLSRDQLRAIAERKRADLNTDDVEAAMRIVAGTARSMGVTTESE